MDENPPAKPSHLAANCFPRPDIEAPLYTSNFTDVMLIVGPNAKNESRYRVHKHILAAVSQHLKAELEKLPQNNEGSVELTIKWLEPHYAKVILSWIYGASIISIIDCLAVVDAKTLNFVFSATWVEYRNLYDNALALEVDSLASELVKSFQAELSSYRLCSIKPTKEIFDTIVRMYELSFEGLEWFCNRARNKGKNGMPLVGWLEDVEKPTTEFLKDFMMACARLWERP